MQDRQYLNAVLVAFCLVLGLAATANYLVDPYGLFGSRRIEGFTALKPMAEDRVRVVKPYDVLRARPRTLIVGNSRPEMGLDPASPCWNSDDRPVYNLGIPGASVYMQARYAQHALPAGPVRLVLFGLDFLDFLVREPGPEDFSSWPVQALPFESRLHVRGDDRSNSTYALRWLEDHLKGLFSLQGVSSSIYTLLAQRNPNGVTRHADGFNPARDYYLDIIRTEGQEVLFRQKNSQVKRTLSDPSLGIYQNAARWSTEFESIARFLTLAQAHDVEVILFINPYHAEYLATIELAGKWQLLEQWKRRLVQLAENAENVPLWDFNAFNPLTTEPLPEPGDTRATLRWFWEPAHYRKELGELMLARMLGHDCVKRTASQSLGVRLSGKNIDQHLRELRSGLEQFTSTHREVLDRLKR